MIVTGILEESQAAGYERFLLGARILAVNGFAVSNLNDFGRKVQSAIAGNTNIWLSFFPRFVDVPEIDKFEQQPPPQFMRHTSYHGSRSSRRAYSSSFDSGSQTDCT